MNNQNTNQINEDDLLDDPRQAYLSKEKVNVVALKTLETTLSAIEQKKIIDRLNKSFLASEKAKKNYVFSVIKLGEELLEAKQSVGFGYWEVFIKRHSEFRFDERQARKYMQIARHKNLVITFFNNEERLSVNQLTKLIAGATQEQIDEANATTEKKVKPPAPLLPDKPDKKEEVKDHCPPGGEAEKDFIEGECSRLPPEQNDEEDPIELLIIDNKSLMAEVEQLTKIVDSDDQIKTALEEVKRFKELNRVLEERIRGLQGESNQAKGQAKYWKNKYEKLMKEVGRE